MSQYDENEATEVDVNTEFNLENDFKPEPLLPNGVYSGNVIEVSLKLEKACIQWKVALDGNGGYMNDGETPIDGNTVYFNNWLPKKGDEATMTPSGRTTKHQSKVNQLARFAKAMGINMNTIGAIRESIDNGDWIGLPVKITIGTSEYPANSGQFKNDTNQMVAA